MSDKSLGEMIQEARAARYKLREFARLLGTSPTHQSDIENNRRVPSEELLELTAEKLDLDLEALLMAARRVPDNAHRYVADVPEAVSLFRKISAHGLNPDELKTLERKTESIVKKRRAKK
ncbi:MAG TPA: helix-turn-helix transcriptional regulator [Woeseiaceae bacterium]|nr:helix-turn-helix transcriptional regulator [Woeseiaceae bacterium]